MVVVMSGSRMVTDTWTRGAVTGRPSRDRVPRGRCRPCACRQGRPGVRRRGRIRRSAVARPPPLVRYARRWGSKGPRHCHRMSPYRTPRSRHRRSTARGGDCCPSGTPEGSKRRSLRGYWTPLRRSGRRLGSTTPGARSRHITAFPFAGRDPGRPSRSERLRVILVAVLVYRARHTHAGWVRQVQPCPARLAQGSVLELQPAHVVGVQRVHVPGRAGPCVPVDAVPDTHCRPLVLDALLVRAELTRDRHLPRPGLDVQHDQVAITVHHHAVDVALDVDFVVTQDEIEFDLNRRHPVGGDPDVPRCVATEVDPTQKHGRPFCPPPCLVFLVRPLLRRAPGGAGLRSVQLGLLFGLFDLAVKHRYKVGVWYVNTMLAQVVVLCSFVESAATYECPCGALWHTQDPFETVPLRTARIGIQLTVTKSLHATPPF